MHCLLKLRQFARFSSVCQLVRCSAAFETSLRAYSVPPVRKANEKNLSYPNNPLYRAKYDLYLGAEHVLNNLSDEDKEHVKMITTQVEKFNESSFQLIHLKPEDWIFLLMAPSSNKRQKYLEFRAKATVSKINEKMNSKTASPNSEPEVFERNFLNSKFMPKITPIQLKKVQNSWLWKMLEFSQPLVIDMSFEDFMRPNDVNNLAVQLELLYFNMKRDYFTDPFHLHFTSLDPHSFTDWCFRRQMLKGENFEEGTFERMPFTTTPKSYLDLFPVDRLVYLTPNSRESFQDGEWNHDDVYIIGGFVDKVDKRPHTYTKAKKQGIRTKSLPFDRYIDWQNGSKSLSLDVIMKMIFTARDTNGDWENAIRTHLPKRKTISPKSGDSRRLSSLLRQI